MMLFGGADPEKGIELHVTANGTKGKSVEEVAFAFDALFTVPSEATTNEFTKAVLFMSNRTDTSIVLTLQYDTRLNDDFDVSKFIRSCD